MTTRTTPLRVAALGMENTSRAALEVAFRTHRADWCQLTDEEQAQVIIIDGDRLGALELFDSQRRQHPERPVLVLSLREVQLKQAIPVKKPARLEQLLEALREAQRQLHKPGSAANPPRPLRQPRHRSPVTAATPQQAVKSQVEVSPATAPTRQQPPNPQPSAVTPAASSTRTAADALQIEKLQEWCGQAQDFQFHQPPYPEEAFFDPVQYLQGNLLKATQLAKQQQIAVKLTTLYEPIILLPTQRLAAVPIAERRLRALSMMPTRTRPFEPLDETACQQLLAPLPKDCLMPLETLLWKVSLWSARGRLPQGTDPFATVRLCHWPNCTRLPLLPHTLRIAALWHQQPCSVLEAARRLGVPQRYVFAVYSACHALGLLELSQDPSTHSTPLPEKRGFLQRLLTALKRAA